MLIDSDGLKVCPACGERKLADAFAKSKRRPDGLTVYCKACRNARERDRHRADTEGKARRARHYQEKRKDPSFIEAEAERHAEWYAERKADQDFMEARRERDRKWYADHPNYARRKAQRHWQRVTATKEGREAFNAAHAEYMRDRYAVDERFRKHLHDYFRARRARERANGGDLTPEDWQKLCELADGQCLNCGARDVELDHVIPVVRGGSGSVINVQLLCRSCNASKGDQIADYRTPAIMGWLAERVS